MCISPDAYYMCKKIGTPTSGVVGVKETVEHLNKFHKNHLQKTRLTDKMKSINLLKR